MANDQSKENNGSPPAVHNVRIISDVHWRRLAWGAGVLAFLALFVYTGRQLTTISIPLLLALVAAYLFNPVIDWLEKQKIRRSLAILLLFAFLIVVLTWGVVLLAPQIAQELEELPRKVQSLAEDALPWIEQTFGIEIPATLPGALDALGERLLAEEDMTEMIARYGTAVFGEATSWLGRLFGILALPIFSFFLLRDFNLIVDRLATLVPPSFRLGVFQFVREYDRVLSGFVRGQLLVAAILAVLYSIGLSLVGIPLALMVGIVSGIGNAIPYFGTFIGLVFATLMTLLDWQGFTQLLLVYAVFTVVQVLESWLITPKIVGTTVGMSPFLVIVAVLAFGELLGFFGILVAVPLAAAVKILLRETVKRYEHSPLYRRTHD